MTLDWNELSNEGEMWEWNKDVETKHINQIAERLETTEHVYESPDEVFERMEEEWGWTEGLDDEDTDERGMAITGEIKDLSEEDGNGEDDYVDHDDDFAVEEEDFEF